MGGERAAGMGDTKWDEGNVHGKALDINFQLQGQMGLLIARDGNELNIYEPKL
jgi:hypothetical protein